MAVYNPYNPNYIMQEWQSMKDRIDKNMQNYQQVQNQFMQPQQQQSIPQPQIHQNFQIAPQTNPSELQSAYVNNIDEVKNIFMTRNGIFVNKDLSTLWFKNTEGNIRTFTLAEVIEKDAKDMKIEELEKQIEEMKSLIQTEAKKKTKKEVE